MAEDGSDGERFLESVEQHLPFDEPERADILDELRSHLADSAAAMEAKGLDRAEAERAAVERLGPAERLADELTRARRDRTRLLAAAGAGAWGLVRGGVWGGLVGWAVVTVAALLISTAIAVAARQTGGAWNGLDTGTSAIPNIVALGVAVFVAARLLTPTFAARAGYAAPLVRWLTMPIGAALVLTYALAIWSGPLNWPGVVALVTLPLWWVAGAWQTRPFRLAFPRRIAVGLAVAVGVLFGANALFGPMLAGSARALAWPAGSDRIAAPMPYWAAKAGSGGTTFGGYEELTLDVSDRTLLTGWTDLRIEAWRGTDPARGAGLDPTETVPFLTAPLQWSAAGTSPDGNSVWYGGQGWPANAATLTGGLRLDRSPAATWAWLALTGVAPDGQRHLLSSLSGSQVFFHGTVLDWFGAVFSGG
jgi:hypothetical protein